MGITAPELYEILENTYRVGTPAALEYRQLRQMLGETEREGELWKKEFNHWLLGAVKEWERANNPRENPIVREAALTSMQQCFEAAGLKINDPLHCALIHVKPEEYQALSVFLKEEAAEQARTSTPERRKARLMGLWKEWGIASLAERIPEIVSEAITNPPAPENP